MDLTPYVDNLRRELAVAAEAGGEDARELAERLTAPLESATRLTMLHVLSAAMDEITRELAPGSVDIRLRGLDPDFVVTLPPANPGQAYPTANVPPQWVPPTANGPTGYLMPNQGRPFPAQPTGLGPNFQGIQGYPGGYAPAPVPQQWAPAYWGNPQGAFPGR